MNSENFASSDAAAVNPLQNALAALGRKDYATAKWLFEALGRNDAAEAIENALAALDRKDYATAQGLFEALALPKPAASAAYAAYRQPLPRAEKAKGRGLKRLLLGTGLVLIVIFGVYGSRLNWTFDTAKSHAIAGLASAVDLIKAPLEAITGPSGREEERSAMRDLSAALTQVTTRLDQIEHEYGARLDKLSERVEQNASADIAPPPAAPAAEFAKVAAKVDELEKKVADAAQPASEFADVTTRLNNITTRLDRLEKRAAALAASSAKPLPPAVPKPH